MMANTAKKLRLIHGYKNYANTCRNCKHFKVDDRFHEPENGIYAYNCVVDAEHDNINQEVYHVKTPFGVCDSHERIPVRREDIR